MGNKTNSNSAPPSPHQCTIDRHNATAKEIHISTNHVDGFHFTNERLTGTVKIPRSFLHRHLTNIKNPTPTESLHNRFFRSAVIIELIGDATYSAEVDAAADSDGHVAHKVNVCRERCIVTIHHNKTESESIVHSSLSSDSISMASIPPPVVNGTFQIHIPDGLPPSLANERPPSVIYALELSLSSSHSRYQIPITLSSRGYIPHPMSNIELSDSAVNRNDIQLRAYISRSFYRPGEQIPVRITYSNPQQRFIRSITVRLLQIYRIHNDQNQIQIDGKEWTFDVPIILPQRQWTGETRLQLFDQQLQASYSTHYVGTTQTIECELHYRINIELNEKKGDDIHLTLSPIQVTYQK